MSFEHKKAIDRIIALCEKSRTPSKRLVRIYDIALESVGLVKSQRDEILTTFYESRLQAERDKMEAREARKIKNN